MKKILLPLIPMFGIFLALFAIEIVFRLLPSAKKSTWSDRPVFYFGAPNAPTLQGRAYQANKPADVYRIAVIGDSFTFAPYMQFTDAFPAKLEQMLNLDSKGTKKVEVINYGVPAYSTSHEVAVAEKAVAEGADLIILEITLNDPEIKAHRPTGITENMEDRFGPLKFSGWAEPIVRHWHSLKYVLERLHNSKTFQDYADYFNDLFENPKTWNPFTSNMKKLVGTAKSANVPIVAVVFPLFGLPMDDSYPFYGIHKKVDEFLTTLDLPHTDLSDLYKGIPLDRLQVIPGVDRHPNEIAHRMAAEKIYLWLEQLKLVPDDFKITEKYQTRLGISGQKPLVENTLKAD